MNTLLPRKNTFLLIGKSVWLELIRRQDLYICLIMLSLFLLGVLVMRIVGIDTPATGTFILNMGMMLASICAHLLLLFFAARQFPSEIENRTLYPLLARPIRRSDILLAKWLAVSLGGILVYTVLLCSVWFSVPKLEAYDTSLLYQTYGLHVLSLLWLSGMSMAFSLLLPRGLAVLLSGIFFFAGGSLRQLMSGNILIRRLLAAYIPDFGMLNLTTRYTDGIGALAVSDLLALVGYGVLMIACFVSAARYAFQGKRL